LQRKHWYREWEHTYHQLNDWLAIWTAHIDFCEYTEIGQAPARAIEKSVVYRGLLRIQQALHEQMASAAVGHLGPQRVVFCGPPNAGKSTMINLLLGQDKILVSDIAGTTRDAVETAWHTEHGVLKLVDTAGLWEAPAGSLDADAVAITQRTLDEACQVVWLIPPGMTHIWPYVPRGAHIWASRADEWMASDIREDFIGRVKACGGIFQGWLSARSREGLSDFQEYLLQQLKTPAGIYLTDRQHQCLQKVLDSVAETLVCFEKELPEDMLQAALQPAHQAMGALLGYHTEQDMLDRLFSRFCIGK
jgi:tRNA modification GTPase